MLNVRQVEAFRATMMTGSVSAAARRLNVSQPSVSRLLRDLERSVGFRLFNRSGRGIVPTHESQLLFEAVERLFGGLAQLDETARDVRRLSTGGLRLGAIPALALDATSQLVSDLYAAVGPVAVDVQVRSSYRILEWIRAHQLDIGLVNLDTGLHDVERVASWKFRCVCMVPAHHQLAADARPVDLRRVQDPIVTVEPQFMASISPDRDTAELFNRASALRVGIWLAAPSFAQRGLGIAVVDPFTAQCFARMPNLVVRDLQQDLRFELTLIRPALRQPSLMTQKFTEIAVHNLDQWESAMGSLHAETTSRGRA